jgi:hypothetical protein
MPDDSYVTNAAWLRQAARPDAIDEVADQFERPADGAAAFWSGEEAAPWPRSSRGWRSMERMHPRALERRAG